MTPPELQRLVGPARVSVVQGDITEQDVDAIVNAANSGLKHGGGVAAAIARAAGPELQRESERWVAEHGPVRRGQAAVTDGGRLPATHVLHVVGPVYEAGSADNEPHLRDAVRAALQTAVSVGARTVALPAISAGIYGYPPDDATRVIADEVVRFLADEHDLEEVRLVGLDAPTAERFRRGVAAAGGLTRAPDDTG